MSTRSTSFATPILPSLVYLRRPPLKNCRRWRSSFLRFHFINCTKGGQVQVARQDSCSILDSSRVPSNHNKVTVSLMAIYSFCNNPTVLRLSTKMWCLGVRSHRWVFKNEVRRTSSTSRISWKPVHCPQRSTSMTLDRR